MEYRRFFLSPGQQAPPGSTGRSSVSGGTVWRGEAGLFPAEIKSQIMTAEEIADFEKRLAVQSASTLEVAGKSYVLVMNTDQGYVVAEKGLTTAPLMLVNLDSIKVV